MELVLASANKGKVIEIQRMLPASITVQSLIDVGILESIPEPFDTFKENAYAKAHYVQQKTGKNCFAEDSGLIVPALNGAPGVYSARYAGAQASDEDNNLKLIEALMNIEDRTAYYQSTLCLIWEGHTYYFEGKCMGYLQTNPEGSGGFGYDPLFIPDGYSITMAMIPLEEKNKISHRGKAMQLFLQQMQLLA
jgi:XTP/dITP diphosphohydrolase